MGRCRFGTLEEGISTPKLQDALPQSGLGSGWAAPAAVWEKFFCSPAYDNSLEDMDTNGDTVCRENQPGWWRFRKVSNPPNVLTLKYGRRHRR